MLIYISGHQWTSVVPLGAILAPHRLQKLPRLTWKITSFVERREFPWDVFGRSGRCCDNKLCPLSFQSPTPPPSAAPPLPPLSGWLVANWEVGYSVRESSLSPEGSPSLQEPRPPLLCVSVCDLQTGEPSLQVSCWGWDTQTYTHAQVPHFLVLVW